MNLTSIKNKLENVGYVLIQSPEQLNVGTKLTPDPGLGPEGAVLDGFCTIKIVENEAIIGYFRGMFVVDNAFTSESDIVSFLKKEFPL
jgi:hypothetical protein